jgi:ankyrin repeat protein
MEEFGWSKLMIAAESRNMKSLEESQDDVNFCTPREKLTALAIACRAGNFNVVAVLISRGADCRSDRRGWTPLHWSAISGHLECLEILTRNFHGLLNAQDLQGNTALHWAVLNRKTECRKSLERLGANTAILNFEGFSNTLGGVMKESVFERRKTVR